MNQKSVLAVGAHPDDIEFSCTGKLLKLKDEGYDIYYVVATNGENGFKIERKSRKERIQFRYDEQIEAAKQLNVKQVFFLGNKDGFLINTSALRKSLVRIIKKTKPGIIFTFDPANTQFDNINLYHIDHRNIAIAVFDAVFAAKSSFMFPGKPHLVNSFYFFGSSSPNYFEDITSLIDKKIEILKNHKSQFSDFSKAENWVRNTLSKGTDKYLYSEAYRVLHNENIFK